MLYKVQTIKSQFIELPNLLYYKEIASAFKKMVSGENHNILKNISKLKYMGEL